MRILSTKSILIICQRFENFSKAHHSLIRDPLYLYPKTVQRMTKKSISEKIFTNFILGKWREQLLRNLIMMRHQVVAKAITIMDQYIFVIRGFEPAFCLWTRFSLPTANFFHLKTNAFAWIKLQDTFLRDQITRTCAVPFWFDRLFNVNDKSYFEDFETVCITRGLPKYLKMAVTEIGHLHEYAYQCQNTWFLFSL